MLDRNLTAMPIEGAALDPSWNIVASAFHTVADITSWQTYGRGVDAGGIYAAFATQYNVRPVAQFNISNSPGGFLLEKYTVAFQLRASGDGMVMENDAGAFNTNGIELYYESSTNKFYYIVTSVTGSGITNKTGPCPSQNVEHTYVVLLDRSVSGAGAVAAAYVDGVAQTLTTVNSSFAADPFIYSNMTFMARNAGASLNLTGRLRNLHVATGLWSYGQILAFQNNPCCVFAPEPALYAEAVGGGGGSAAQSRFFLAA